MKTSLLALFFTLSVNICMAQDDFFVGAWLQANDLMYDSSYGYSNIEYNATPWEIRPIDSVLKQGYKTSRINVLKEFGVDFYWMASPSPWNISSVNANRKVFKLFFNHGVKVIGDIDYWFNPIPINGEYINTIGYIDFNGAPDNANWNTNKLGRPNYNEIIPQITYNPAVLGFMLGGELAYRSGHYYNISGNRVDWGNREALCQTSEISPTHLYEAINLVKELSSKKIFLQVGTHTAVINDNTDDFRFWSKHIDGDNISCGNRVYQFIEDTLDVNPQDHFQVPEKYPDYLIEGSYFELNLKPDWTYNDFSYPMNCFRYKYKNLLKSGTGIDGYPLNYNSTFSCPIYKERDGFNDTAINGDNRHYLSKFRNIDYFRNKGIDVISEFSSFQTKFVSEYDSTDPSTKYLGHYERDMGNWNSTSFVNNANYFWFNAYNSIVHGVVGILPYIEYLKLFTNPCHEMLLLKDVANINLEEFQYRVFYEDSEFFQNKDIKQGSIVFDCDANYNGLILPEEMDYYRGLVFKALQKLVFSTRGEFNQSNPNATWQDGRKTRFDYDFWSPAFKDFIGPLYNEISLLKRMGFLNKGSLIHRRIDHPDEQCLLLPHDSLYIKKCENQSMGIPNKYIDVIEDYYQKNENNNTYSGPIKFKEFRNENYGLRYILLSNQDRVNEEYILIVSNQLNLPLLDVPLNISHFPVLRDMS